MSTERIDLNKVIKYSLQNCKQKSMSKCALYVKRAFEAGGCTYVTGNGWSNQSWCKTNDFQCIGDFVPADGNARAHKSMPIQFPAGYVQKTGDVCLIKHGQHGHICYATGPGINDWVSDYFQKSPGQQNGTGPYCYTGGYERVQFWRHSSYMNGEPVVELTPEEITQMTQTSRREERKARRQSSDSSNSSARPGTPNNISHWSGASQTSGKNKGTILGMHMRQK